MPKLSEWMRSQNLTARQVAEGISELLPQGESVSASAVEKWKYRLRTPRKKQMGALTKYTAGAVTPNDFADLAETIATTPAPTLRKAS